MQSLIIALELNVFYSGLCKIPQQQQNSHISEFQVHISNLNVSDNGFCFRSPNAESFSTAVGDFYGTGIEIWAGFGPDGITE